MKISDTMPLVLSMVDFPIKNGRAPHALQRFGNLWHKVLRDRGSRAAGSCPHPRGYQLNNPGLGLSLHTKFEVQAVPFTLIEFSKARETERYKHRITDSPLCRVSVDAVCNFVTERSFRLILMLRGDFWSAVRWQLPCLDWSLDRLFISWRWYPHNISNKRYRNYHVSLSADSQLDSSRRSWG